MADPRRILACAFAGADVLFEVDPSGLVGFAAGATGGVGELSGRSWRDLFAAGDVPLVSALFEGLAEGRRAGPVGVRGGSLGAIGHAALNALRLPGGAEIFCNLQITPSALLVSSEGAEPDGLFAGTALERLAATTQAAAQAGGFGLELGLLHFNGLVERLAELPPDDAAQLEARVVGAVRAEAYAGAAAARLGPDRFAVLRRPGDTAERTIARLARVVGLAAEATLTPLELESDRGLKMLRASVDAFVRAGRQDRSAALDLQMERVVREAGLFGTLVAERRYKLAFQPIVSLADGTTHHFETLVRFDGGESPYAMIRLAEELDLIEALDGAVLADACARLRTKGAERLRLAVNMSGRSIASDAFVERALAAIGRDLGGRLLIELTESSEVDDLDGAAARLHSLRDRKIEICLDDFGVGAAAFDYLRRLPVDAVKIDGRYVREMDTVERSRALVRHVAELCRELKVSTVAEMVETPRVEAALKAAGVGFGQGYLYGAPADEPTPYVRPVGVVARRRGATEDWS